MLSNRITMIKISTNVINVFLPIFISKAARGFIALLLTKSNYKSSYLLPTKREIIGYRIKQGEKFAQKSGILYNTNQNETYSFV